jgi:hypothetical protein
MTRWAKCVAFMMKMRNWYRSFAGNLQVKSSVGILDSGVRRTLKRIFDA